MNHAVCSIFSQCGSEQERSSAPGRHAGGDRAPVVDLQPIRSAAQTQRSSARARRHVGAGARSGTDHQLSISTFRRLRLATVVSLLLAYATVMPFFRPIVALLSKLRFLSLVGLTFFFTLMAKTRPRAEAVAAGVLGFGFLRHRHGRRDQRASRKRSSIWRARCAWANGAWFGK